MVSGSRLTRTPTREKSPKGQTHLTALGALVQLERLLGLDGMPPPAPGIVYPDTAPQIDSVFQVFRNFGVTVTTS